MGVIGGADQVVGRGIEAREQVGDEALAQADQSADAAAAHVHRSVTGAGADRHGAVRGDRRAELVGLGLADQQRAVRQHAHVAVGALVRADVHQLREALERLVALVAQVVGRHAAALGGRNLLVGLGDLLGERVHLADLIRDLPVGPGCWRAR